MRLPRLFGTTNAVGIGASLLAVAASVRAVSFPIVGRTRSSPQDQLLKRAVNMYGSFGNGSIEVSNFGDTSYSCNISLGGVEIEISIDTGSSDLWVTQAIPGAKNLSVLTGNAYGAGESIGFIHTTTMEFDGITIPDQAYYQAINNASELPNPTGILGLGPSNSSTTLKVLNGSVVGATPLDRIFMQDRTTPNFISIELSSAPDKDFGDSTREVQFGQLSIGEVLEGFEAILNETKLPALVDQFGDQHWQTLLDGNGIIGPDGQRINTTTSVTNPTAGAEDQLHVVFDTGFTFPQVPRVIADAIYGRIPGATFVVEADGLTNFWVIPCDYELNVTFLFAGVEYPVSPLDLSLNVGAEVGNQTCISGFQQTADNIAGNAAFGALDAILGMGFLRNVYILINFGDFVEGSNSSVAPPYIQLLSTLNRTAAHLDFVNSRLGGVDTTGSQAPLLPPDQAQHSPSGNSTSSGASTGLSTVTNAISTSAGAITTSIDTIITSARTISVSNVGSTSVQSGTDVGVTGYGTGTSNAVVSTSTSTSSNVDAVADADLNSQGMSTKDGYRVSSNSDSSSEPVYEKTWFIVLMIVLGVIVLALVGFAVLRLVRRRRSNVRSEAVFVPPLAGEASYKPLTGATHIGHDDDALYRTKYDEPSYDNDGRYA
ncbi:hypothetical protein M0805_008007 [Coniferiporia weirii]|nr:hypothetical protein M0805_008007 [Coniferiporia weirii]